MSSPAGNQLNALNGLYHLYDTGHDKDVLQSHWIHEDLTVVEKGMIGKLASKWKLTKIIYNAIYKTFHKADMAEVIKNFGELCKNNELGNQEKLDREIA